MSDMAIDMSHLEKYTAGDHRLLDEILTIFIDHAGACLARLDPEAPDGMWKDACHSLKGASRGVGAWALGDAAAEAEALVGALPGVVSVRVKLLERVKAAAAEAVDYAHCLRRESAEQLQQAHAGLSA